LLSGGVALASPGAPAAAHTPAAAAEAKAEAGGGGSSTAMADELNVGNLVVTIIIFFLLFVVVTKAGWKPIMTGLQDREKAIRDSIEAAAKAKADAEKSTRELESRIA